MPTRAAMEKAEALEESCALGGEGGTGGRAAGEAGALHGAVKARGVLPGDSMLGDFVKMPPKKS